MKSAFSQVTSDNTLGSTISPDTVIRGILSNQIDGGARRGANLFHSFREFNVGEGRGIYFSDPGGIQNIISRVTGRSPSNILGTLGVLGNANLFLLNPNGIFFGPNARLDLNGSFIGSTASSIRFSDGSQFSTTDSSPTLTISTPLGLQFGQAAAEIRSQGAQLGVKPSQTLALLGGNVTLEGSLLVADGGRVELGSVSSGSSVGIVPVSNGLALNYDSVQNFQTIQLSQQSRIQAAEPLGSVTIQAGQFIAQEGSVLSVSTFGSGDGGALTIRAAELVELIGTKTNLFGQVTPTAQGKGGDITVETQRLSLRDGAQISSSTYGTGNAGAVRIRASKSVELSGNATALFATVQQGAAGNGGDINIETEKLLVEKGASINTSTSGKGNAGNLTIRASDIDLVGPVSRPDVSTTTSTRGNTTTTTTIITIRPPLPNDLPIGLFAQAREGSEGNGGNISIETETLRVRDNADISTSTFSQGRVGDLVINASGNVELDFGGIYAQVLETAQGGGGNITIRADTLELKRGSVVSASNLGAGAGGNLEVTAKNIFLGNRKREKYDQYFSRAGKLTAESASGNGGNLTLNVQNALFLRFGSLISATAGTAASGGDGGNITINAPFIIAVLRENSDIRANAFNGRGGNIRISSQRIFGILEQPFDTPNSDITASSTRGVAGTVIITTPKLDPIRDLDKLPANQPSPRDIAQGCEPNKARASRFITKLQGKLPDNPVERLGESQGTGISKATSSSTSDKIIEAQGWIRHPDNPNLVFLKAQPSSLAQSSPRSISPCDDP